MNSKKTALIITFLAISITSFAQTIQLLNSTRQSWSGGVAGRYGDNFMFEIAFSGYKQEVIPDTLWIQDEMIVLSNSDTGGYARNCIMKRKSNKMTFTISGGTSHDEYLERNNLLSEVQKTHPHPAYKGIALLSYRYKGQQHFYEIKKILKYLEPINYP